MPMFIRSALFALGALFAFGAVAQPGPDEAPPGDASDQPDPPSRVARLSYIHGAVSFVPAGENDWVEAQLNRPLITGDKLYTDRGARAELEIGSAALRIDEGTTFDFLNLDDQNAQVELTEGALNVRVRRLYDNQVYEIDTPTLAFVIDRIGEYRIDVQPNGEGTIVSVVRGSGDAYGEGGARFRVEEGQSVTFHDSQLRDYEDDALPRPDAFDEFIAQRDGRWDHARSRQYVSEDVIGYEDLDDNGEWSDVPEYGHVWYPTTVDIGWSPYHYGHWGWVGAYGWTWIDDAPWGFAPFHYGRWAFVGNRWGWCPGPIAVRPYYAPALVAFIGGGGVGVSISLGGPIGWFPLGPRDVYFPGYHVSRRYFTDVNISNTVVNTTIINNYYGGYARGTLNYGEIGFHNRQVAGAVVAVPAAAFVSARPVHAAAIAVNRDTFANARVSSFAAVAPTRQSLVGPGARAAHVPPPTALNRPIVAASKPPPPVASFAAREAVLQKNPGRPLGIHEMRTAPLQQGPAGQQAGTGRAAAMGGPANVKVVTNTGAPLRTPAAPLVSRGNAANAGARAAGENRRGVGNANAAGPANAGTPPRGPNELRATGREAGTRGPGREVGNATPGANRAGNANAPGNAQNEHLQSSRFVHGNDNAANNAAAERGNRDARQLRGQQNNVDTGRGPGDRGVGRAQTGERQPPSNVQQRPVDSGAAANAAAERNARDNAARRGNAQNARGATDNTVRGNADVGRGNAARGPSEERVLRSNAAPANAGNAGAQGRGNERSNAVDRSQQQDRTPQYRENTRRAPPQPEAQRVQPPPQQPQYQRVQPPPPPPQRVEQPQYRQPPPQQRQPPPQQQPPRGQAQQQQGRGQDQGKRKKDEDKNGGGR